VLAFNDDPKKKEFYAKRMEDHAAADDIEPKWLAALADKIFEGLPNKKAKQFAASFYPAMKVGLDLEQVKKDFLIFVLQENLKYLDACVYEKENHPDVAASIKQTKEAIEICIDYQKGTASREDAGTAAWSAVSAEPPQSAVWSAWSGWSAWSAARSAAKSAWAAAGSENAPADSAVNSADSAVKSAWSVWSAEPATESLDEAARLAAYESYAEKLLELLRGNEDCEPGCTQESGR
jgi:hypothetical protein